MIGYRSATREAGIMTGQQPSPPPVATDAQASLPGDRVLAVALHAFTLSPSNMSPVVRVIQKTIPSASCLVPHLPLGLFSTANPTQIARQVMGLIEAKIAFRESHGWPPFEEIILVGHSLGALLARKIYVLAGPESADAPFEDSTEGVLSPEKSWFGSIKRIILLAGMNRGWKIDHHLSIPRSVGMQIGVVFGDLLLNLTGKRLIIFHSRRGSAFLTELRLQWLALQRHMDDKQREKPITVQLLGTIDDLVAPDDNVDLVTGRDFVYLDVPFSGHTNVIEMYDNEAGPKRTQVFAQALCEDLETLAARNLVPEDLDLVESRRGVSDVIFVIHGIRDVGYWTKKIARKVEALGNAPPRIYASETSSYGYLAMIPFLLPSRRREKTEWLMDQYVDAKSLYPTARFSYVGHSNGTYLLANALHNYRGCRFDRVVFAGSVVRTDYDWSTRIARCQVEGVMNYVATWDWVVALFPGALEILNLQDLGSAGHNGFSDPSPNVLQCKFLPGAHSAALTEENWDDIARFITSPELLPSASPKRVDRRKAWLVFAGSVAPLVWVILLGIAALPGYGVLHLVSNQTVRILVFVAYLWAIWKVLTRV